MKTWLAKIVGKILAKKINLKEGPVEDKKKWFLSKGIWTGIVTGVLGIYMSLQPQLSLPAIPEWVFALLGALGVYSRVVAEKQVG